MKEIKSYDELKDLEFKYLSVLWKSFFKGDVPNTRQMMLRPIWYRIQSQKYGGLKQKHITKLNRYSENIEKRLNKSVTSKYKILTGVEFKKVYKGQEHHIKVIDSEQFLYKDCIYPNLSSVAFTITGRRVSGYDFFGLRKRDK